MSDPALYPTRALCSVDAIHMPGVAGSIQPRPPVNRRSVTVFSAPLASARRSAGRGSGSKVPARVQNLWNRFPKCNEHDIADPELSTDGLVRLCVTDGDPRHCGSSELACLSLRPVNQSEHCRGRRGHNCNDSGWVLSSGDVAEHAPRSGASSAGNRQPFRVASLPGDPRRDAVTSKRMNHLARRGRRRTTSSAPSDSAQNRCAEPENR